MLLTGAAVVAAAAAPKLGTNSGTLGLRAPPPPPPSFLEGAAAATAAASGSLAGAASGHERGLCFGRNWRRKEIWLLPPLPPR